MNNKMLNFMYLVSTVLLLTASVDSARILAVFPLPGKSHFIAFSNLLNELANRGHHMTVISAFPRQQPLKNYVDITTRNYFLDPVFAQENTFEMFNAHPILMIPLLRHMLVDVCDEFLSEPGVKSIIDNSEQQFDLVIYEPFFSECAYGLVHKTKAPFIQISSNTITQWMGDGVGNVFSYSYIPDLVLGYTDNMSFSQRLMNTVTQTLMDWERKWISIPRMEAVMKKHFNDGDMPSVLEIERNASLLLLNSHVSLNYPRPFTPNTIEVGGMHINEPKKLPENLQKLLDEATEGVIYFSLGTNIKSGDMPRTMHDALLKTFSKLKQKVLWKWEDDTLRGKPKNVHISKWFPQNDILGHPNTKLFITHGGLLSTQEATFFGVPLVAIPVIADQQHNAAKAANQGYAIALDFKAITQETFESAVNEILTNNRYRERAQHLSAIFRDQPQKPLERAVFWTEYVLRHRGARHLRSAALDLNSFQFFSLDVIAVFVAGFVLFALFAYFSSKFVLKIVLKRNCKSKTAKLKVTLKKKD